MATMKYECDVIKMIWQLLNGMFCYKYKGKWCKNDQRISCLKKGLKYV